MMDRLPELFVWGIGDSLTPGHLAVLAWFIAACVSLSQDRKALAFFSIPFLVTFYILSLMFLTGFFGPLFVRDEYLGLSQTVFIFLGVWLFFTGGELFMRWLRETRGPGQVGVDSVDLRIMPFARILRVPVAVLLAAALSFALVAWAPTGYLTVLSTDMMLPGKWMPVVTMLAVYSFIKIFFMVFICVGAFFLKTAAQSRRKPVLHRSTAYILIAAFYIAIGAGIVVVSFKQF